MITNTRPKHTYIYSWTKQTVHPKNEMKLGPWVFLQRNFQGIFVNLKLKFCKLHFLSYKQWSRFVNTHDKFTLSTPLCRQRTISSDCYCLSVLEVIRFWEKRTHVDLSGSARCVCMKCRICHLMFIYGPLGCYKEVRPRCRLLIDLVYAGKLSTPCRHIIETRGWCAIDVFWMTTCDIRGMSGLQWGHALTRSLSDYLCCILKYFQVSCKKCQNCVQTFVGA